MTKAIQGIMFERGRGKKMPLYQQIDRHLRLQIESGKLDIGERLPSVSFMAAHWKVEPRTVLSALESLEQDGLIRNQAERGKGPVVTGTSRCECSIMFARWISDSAGLQITEGIRRFAAEKQAECIIIDASDTHEHFVDVITNPIADNMIVMPYEHTECLKAIKNALALGVKMVFVDRYIKGLPVSSVSTDHINGAFQATTHLLRTHNCPVYYFGFAGDCSSARDRLNGWAMAMCEYNFHEIEPYACESELKEHGPESDRYYEHHSQEIIKLFRKRKENKYCIFAVNDHFAKAVYIAAEKLNLKIGKDVFIVGFGDLPLCQQLPVPLSSVGQENEQVGYEAAKLLYMNIIGSAKCPVHRKIQSELYIRQSSTGKVQSNIPKDLNRKRKVAVTV